MGHISIKRQILFFSGVIAALFFFFCGTGCFFVWKGHTDIDFSKIRLAINDFVYQLEKQLNNALEIKPSWMKKELLELDKANILESILLQNKEEPKENNTKLKNNKEQNKRENKLSNLEKSSIEFYGWILIDLEGKICYRSGNTSFLQEDIISLRKLSGIEYTTKKMNIIHYTVPILINEKQEYYLCVGLKQELYRKINWKFLFFGYFIIILAILGILLEIVIYKKVKNTVFKPIQQLNNATKTILEGDFTIPLRYDYEDETGILCHNFEQMRGELLEYNRREQEIREKEKVLLACISHDLKTPLASILGYVEGIKSHLVTEKEGIERYCDIILEKVHLLSRLIHDILEQTKTELDEFPIKKEELYADEFFSSFLEELSIEVEKEDRELQINEVPRVILTVDKYRIQQVMNNIIGNSVKYSKPKTKISIQFSLEEWNGRKELIVIIEDNGKGIDSIDIPFIFDKFYRGEKARTQDIPGSGLGLYITKYIITKHEGRIECDSILGIGTTILFSLPL